MLPERKQMEQAAGQQRSAGADPGYERWAGIPARKPWILRARREKRSSCHIPGCIGSAFVGDSVPRDSAVLGPMEHDLRSIR